MADFSPYETWDNFSSFNVFGPGHPRNEYETFPPFPVSLTVDEELLEASLPGERGLVHQNSDSSLGSQYSRFAESTTPVGRGQRLSGAYGCTQCNASFDVPSDLRQHERKHIPKEQLPHACTAPNCEERFLYPKDARRHFERKHSRSGDSSLGLSLEVSSDDASKQTTSVPGPDIQPEQRNGCQTPDEVKRVNEQLGLLRHSIPELRHAHLMTGELPDKLAIITCAVKHIHELREDSDSLTTRNCFLEDRIQELEKWRAELGSRPSTATRLEGHIATGCCNPSKKRKATNSPETDIGAPISCECSACGTKTHCLASDVLNKTQAEIQTKLDRVKKEAEVWRRELKNLLVLVYGLDDDHPGPNSRKTSFAKRATSWITGIKSLIRVKKKASGESFEPSARALEQLTNDIEELMLR